LELILNRFTEYIEFLKKLHQNVKDFEKDDEEEEIKKDFPKIYKLLTNMDEIEKKFRTSKKKYIKKLKSKKPYY
jgi:hypothetical protein